MGMQRGDNGLCREYSVLCNVTCARAGNCIVEKANLTYRTILLLHLLLFLLPSPFRWYLYRTFGSSYFRLAPANNTVAAIDLARKCHIAKQDEEKVLWGKKVLRACLIVRKMSAGENERERERDTRRSGCEISVPAESNLSISAAS